MPSESRHGVFRSPDSDEPSTSGHELCEIALRMSSQEYSHAGGSDGLY